MSAAAFVAVDYDPIRDKSYRDTALGRDVADFLAWHELGGSATPRSQPRRTSMCTRRWRTWRSTCS